ncbi:LppM family (lipo)protein [Kribbella sp. NPDC056951]|uniref:LppM family (lipo)protein n=1 Tax=Kribbella sp. NPDC056951 TaxID=3345978 RepID=UPI003642DB37
MRKKLIVVVIAVLAVFALTGCFRYRAEGTIDANGLVSGSIVIGYDREFVKQQPGQGVYADLSRFMKANAASVSKGTASVAPMDEGQFRGFRITFSEVALADFVQLMRHEEVRAGETGGLDYRLSRQGDEFVFDARVLPDKGGQFPIPPETFERAELMVSLTFPGKVVSSNGTVSGNTVTWSPTITDMPHLTATGKADQPVDVPTEGDAKPVGAEESGGDSNGVRAALVAGAVVLLAAAVGTVWVVLRRRSR